jgi:hypothetical protein
MSFKINKHFARHRTNRPWHRHRPGRQHGLLKVDISSRGCRCLTHDQLLDRECAPLGIKPPDPTLFTARRKDHLPAPELRERTPQR